MTRHPLVLLVDDEANLRRMLGAVLAAEGYVVAEAASGTEAAESVRRRRPDAVFLDLQMPGGPDGLQTLEQLIAEVPGLPLESLRVAFRDRCLVLSGERHARKDAAAGSFLCLERPHGRFERAIPVEVPVDVARAKATLRGGLLTVRGRRHGFGRCGTRGGGEVFCRRRRLAPPPAPRRRRRRPRSRR